MPCFTKKKRKKKNKPNCLIKNILCAYSLLFFAFVMRQQQCRLMGKSAHKKIKCGVTQGRLLYPDFFPPYNDIIMQNLEGYSRIKVGGHNIHRLRYTAAVLIRHLWRRKQKEKVWNEEQKDKSNGGQSKQWVSTHQHL